MITQEPKEPEYEPYTDPFVAAWSAIGVGTRRAIIVAFVLSCILWYPISSEIWDGYYDKEERRTAMIVFPLAYWALVFAGIWIYRGFKK